MLTHAIEEAEKEQLIADFGLNDVLLKPLSKATLDHILQEYGIITENLVADNHQVAASGNPGEAEGQGEGD